jgi:hypothetical protein
MPTVANIVELRRLLTERHPHTIGLRPASVERPVIRTGIPALDGVLHGGWPKGRLAELVGPGPGSGSAQVIHSLLNEVAAAGQFLALVDGRDSFDVDAVEADVLTRLLWVRCGKVDEALKAADILLRDCNFPVIIVDLKLNPITQLRKIPSSVWHRFRRLQEQNTTTLLVVTPSPLVGSAHCRVRVEARLGLDAFTQPPAEILSRLNFELLRGEEETVHDSAGTVGAG